MNLLRLILEAAAVLAGEAAQPTKWYESLWFSLLVWAILIFGLGFLAARLL